jgi:hypothetical protein
MTSQSQSNADLVSAITWQERLNALLDELPDSALADGLKEHSFRKLREQLAVGDGPPLHLLSADALLITDWPEPVWAVPGLLPVGLTILAGKPKVGKSWLALQVAQAVAAGGMVLNQHVEAGPVLYLALEDPPRRLKERLIKQHWPTGLPADFMVIGEFADQVGDLRNGGSEKLARQIQSRGYRLVVIDTLSRSIIGDQNDTQAMTAALTPIQEIAHAHNCAVVLVDHHNKMAGGDAITDILGSTAKGAMVDTAWGIYRERGKTGAKLSITGREVEEKTLSLVMDWTTGCWQCEGDADKMVVVDRHQALLDVLEDVGPAGIVEISELLSRNKGPVYKDIQDLVNEGMVRKIGRGRGNIRYELIEDDVQR